MKAVYRCFYMNFCMFGNAWVFVAFIQLKRKKKDWVEKFFFGGGWKFYFTLCLRTFQTWPLCLLWRNLTVFPMLLCKYFVWLDFVCTKKPMGIRFCFSTFQVWQCMCSVFIAEQHLSLKWGQILFIWEMCWWLIYLLALIGAHKRDLGPAWISPTKVIFFPSDWLLKFVLYLMFCNLKWICFSVNYLYHCPVCSCRLQIWLFLLSWIPFQKYVILKSFLSHC